MTSNRPGQVSLSFANMATIVTILSCLAGLAGATLMTVHNSMVEIRERLASTETQLLANGKRLDSIDQRLLPYADLEDRCDRRSLANKEHLPGACDHGGVE